MKKLHKFKHAFIKGAFKLDLGPPGGDVPADPPPAPELFERQFNGPEAAPAPEVPPHYALHAWIWQSNPSGIFADFNADGSCAAS